jgi:hypothetical protein
MKIIITEQQLRLITESENNLDGIIGYWKKRLSNGERILFDKDELEYWGIDTNQTKSIAQTEFQELVGGEVFTNKFISSLIGKVFSTKDFDKRLTGGYDFKWVIDTVELKDGDFNVYGKLLPGGSVTLMDGRHLSLSDILEDSDLSWEIDGEVSELVYDCMNQIILPITGYEINVPLMMIPEE